MRVAFDDLFRTRPDGTFAARQPMVIGGVQLTRGVEFGQRVRIGGVHFAAVAGRDLEVDSVDGNLHLVRPYVPAPEQHASPPPPTSSSLLVQPLV